MCVLWMCAIVFIPYIHTYIYIFWYVKTIWSEMKRWGNVYVCVCVGLKFQWLNLTYMNSYIRLAGQYRNKSPVAILLAHYLIEFDWHKFSKNCTSHTNINRPSIFRCMFINVCNEIRKFWQMFEVILSRFATFLLHTPKTETIALAGNVISSIVWKT